MKNKVVYIAHPVGGDVAGNIVFGVKSCISTFLLGRVFNFSILDYV